MAFDPERAAAASALASQKANASSALASQKSSANAALATQKASSAAALAVQKSAASAAASADKASFASRLAAQKAFQQSVLSAQKAASSASSSFDKRQHEKEMALIRQETATKVAAIRQANASRAKATDATTDASAASTAATSCAEAEAAALGAVEAVALAAAAAVAFLVVAMASFAAKAIEVVQQRAGLLATFAALGGGAAAGKATLAMVDKLSTKLPFVREQIDAWATSLETAGFRGEALGKAIEAVGAAEAIVKGGGAAAEKMLKTLAEGGKGADKMVKAIREGGSKANQILADMGLSVGDIGTKSQRSKMSVDEMGKAIEKALARKGKDSFALMAMTWPVIIAKSKEGFLSLFEGLNKPIGSFMSAVQKLFAQFTRGTPTMKALGKVVTEVFSTLFRYATMAVNIVQKFVAANVNAKSIGGAWNSIKSAVSKVIAVLMVVWSVLKPIFTSTMFLNGIAAVFKVLAVVILVVVSALGIATAIFGGFFGIIATVGAYLWGFIAEVATLGKSIVDGVMNFDFSAFVAKMAAMATEGLGAFKAVFAFGSPSKVMRQLGRYIGAGAEKGTDEGTGNAVKSAGKLGAGMLKGAATGASGKGAGSGGGLTINGGVHLHADGSGQPAAWVEEAWAALIERMAASQGV